MHGGAPCPRLFRDLDELRALQGIDRRHLFGRPADDVQGKLARLVGDVVRELHGDGPGHRRLPGSCRSCFTSEPLSSAFQARK